MFTTMRTGVAGAGSFLAITRELQNEYGRSYRLSSKRELHQEIPLPMLENHIAILHTLFDWNIPTYDLALLRKVAPKHRFQRFYQTLIKGIKEELNGSANCNSSDLLGVARIIKFMEVLLPSTTDLQMLYRLVPLSAEPLILTQKERDELMCFFMESARVELNVIYEGRRLPIASTLKQVLPLFSENDAARAKRYIERSEIL